MRKEDDDDRQAQNKKLRRFMFSPEIGRSTHVLGQSLDMFVRMVALLFMQARLLSKDDPSVKPQEYYDERLPKGSFSRIMHQAWANLELEFSRENLYPMIVFFSVVFALMIIPIMLFIFLYGYTSGVSF